jgi:hypothetical protein
VRRYSSDDAPEAPVADRNIPDYWIRPWQALSARAGLHRFVWDLRHAAPEVDSFTYPIAATYANTPREPRGPLVVPGRYTVRLKVGGLELERPIEVVIDPRVKASADDLALQSTLALRLVDAMGRARNAQAALRRAGGPRAGASVATAQPLAASLTLLTRQLAQLYERVEQVDSRAHRRGPRVDRRGRSRARRAASRAEGSQPMSDAPSDARGRLELLRHALATLAYRGGKAVRGAPDAFGAFHLSATSRTPVQVLAHIGDLLDWALSLAQGKEAWHNSPPRAWPDEVARFYDALASLDARLAGPAS